MTEPTVWYCGSQAKCVNGSSGTDRSSVQVWYNGVFAIRSRQPLTPSSPREHRSQPKDHPLH
jgi:hypothetical protein